MIKKSAVLFLCAALTISICSCGSAAGKTETTKAAEDTTIEETAEETASEETEMTAGLTTVQTAPVSTVPDITVTITPPDGWVKVENSVILAQYTKSTASFMVSNESYFSSTNLDDVVTEAKGIFSDSFTNVEYIGDTETITVDGHDARKFFFTCEFGTIPFKYEYIYIKIGDGIYSIVFGDFEETFDALAPDIEKILTDIKFS